ncbi:IclR family transcriptional regulator [Streptomyces sp. HNM0574]|uniref:IclR family transcriptional regulator n=1 Tax=Streptomyces sp. HNM0574 TaxID=2714954 RepID=UPI00146A49DB|nr:IclR family transcriptional regulator [Streptomyces sp. HNM0574]NLU71035.1 IclR family transcriptional regulator [Streptomyces sp. HNM0574]
MAGNTKQAGASVTSRVLAVLETFDVTHQQLTLTEIARRAELPVATVHRLLSELERWRAVERGADGRYRIGLRLWEVGSLASARMQLREAAMPYLHALHEATRAHVFIAVADGADAVYVERFGPHQLRAGSPEARRLRQPLDRSAAGLALLAYQGESRRRGPAPRSQLLDATLRKVRRQGYAALTDRTDTGLQTIAVPVLRPSGRAEAALGLSARATAGLGQWREPLLSAASGMQRVLLGRVDDEPA